MTGGSIHVLLICLAVLIIHWLTFLPAYKFDSSIPKESWKIGLEKWNNFLPFFNLSWVWPMWEILKFNNVWFPAQWMDVALAKYLASFYLVPGTQSSSTPSRSIKTSTLSGVTKWAVSEERIFQLPKVLFPKNSFPHYLIKILETVHNSSLVNRIYQV